MLLREPSVVEFSVGYNVASREAMDRIMKQARKAGDSITNPADHRFWGGHSGCFQDPDGHRWEIAWNP